MQPGCKAAAGVEAWRHQGGGIAGGAGARSCAIDHGVDDPLGEEGAGQRGARDPGADDGDGRRARAAWSGDVRALQPGLQPFTLGAEAGSPGHRETLCLQATAYRAGDGECGRAGAGCRSARHQRQDLIAPHPGILRGGEAVKEPGVGATVPGVQGHGGLGDGDVEDGPEPGEFDPVETRTIGPAIQERGGQVL